TGSPETATPALLVTVTVTVDVLAPSAAMIGGLAVTTVVNGAGGGFAVWMTVTEARASLATSVAVIVQKPTAVEETYVADTMPPASVVPELSVSVPQVPKRLKFTVSPDTGAPALVTVAVMVEVLVPLARRLDGFAVMLTLLGTNSNAPMSQAAPWGRATPRWSAGGGGHTLLATASMAGLPGRSASV